MHHHRRGVLLIIVTGLAALLLSLAVAFLASMRDDGERTRALAQDIQARLMLHAATCYILETARIGWGDDETMGWNDIRNHAVGPIAITADPFAGDPNQPTNRLWTSGTWPAPGSVMRAPVYTWERAPYAVLAGARNPIEIGDAYTVRDDPLNDQALALAGHHGDWGSHQSLTEVWRIGTYDRPDPAPVIDPTVDLAAFAAGDARPRTATSGLAWFRVYREAWEDHDGDGTPYFDVVDLNGGLGTDWSGVAATAYPKNASVFVITCGAGATLGFRDWDEVVLAGAEASFLDDEGFFTTLRTSETILWYRMEWSPTTGDLAAKGRRESTGGPYQALPVNDSANTYSTSSHAGSVRWLQRLDLEPPDW
ncbi:MAG: hypothetical protein H0W72_09535 [Planctomycetes bacterium]|nr:hypothetical protein [Planctomycetota bacterium]